MLGSALLAVAAAELAVRLLAPREAPPAPAEIDLRDYFSEAEIERGARYARPQLGLALARSTVQLAVLAVVARRPPALGMRGERLSPPAQGAMTAAGLALAATAASLPLAAVSRRRARTVGLVTQSWRGWAADVGKAGAIETGLAAAAGAVATVLIERYPRGWWAPAAGGTVLFGTALGALAPVLLDPLFNDFEPLPDGRLRADVLELAAAAGVRVGEVYSIDASRRTTAANAYVTGLGPTKRVVLFDTLIDRYGRDEVRTVVAHELSHVRHRDVIRGVAYAAIVAGPATFAAQRLGWALAPGRAGAAALPGLALATALVGAPIGMVGNRLSRAIERRADAYALALSGVPEAFVSFERAIALQNVADLDPPRWVRHLLATHPATAERIGVAVAATRSSPRTPAGS